MSRLVVVLPLKEGARERARSLLEEGPPFELEKTAFDRHEVFLSNHEVVFLFDGPGDRGLELPAENPVLWRAARAWSKCMAARPRVARTEFSWRRQDEAEVREKGEE